MKSWEMTVLGAADAADRVAAIEDELRLAAGLTTPRKTAPSKTAPPPPTAAPDPASRRDRTAKPD
ncbi:MAG: hypothetical protein NVS3B26_17530 [Mycobacteriales bacterium]